MPFNTLTTARDSARHMLPVRSACHTATYASYRPSRRDNCCTSICTPAPPRLPITIDSLQLVGQAALPYGFSAPHSAGQYWALISRQQPSH